MSVGFGIRQTSDGTGTSDSDIRHIFSYKWLNKGVVGGLKVTGGTNTYNIAQGLAICGNGTGYGLVEAYYPGGNSGTVSGNASSNPRIDAVWIKANDVSMGDPNNQVTVGVTEGTPSANPAVPSVPAYATLIAGMRVAAGSTTTNATSAVVVDYAIPYGASMGILADFWLKTDTDWEDNKSAGEKGIGSIKFNVPTDRIIALKTTITAGAINGKYTDGDGSMYVIQYVDGTQKARRELRLRKIGNAVSQYFEEVFEIGAGDHTLRTAFQLNACDQIHLYYSDNNWPGQRVIVYDMGPVV